MYQVLGPKILIGTACWLAVSIFLMAGHFGVSVNARIVVAVVDGTLLIGLANPVWRFIWNRTGPLGRWLSKKVYPDLNGTYDVVLESNWPIVKRMLDASRKEDERFDPFNLDQPAPDLQRVELEATIEQTWFDICMRMYPKATGAVIKSSRTLVTAPLESTAAKDKELVYLFEQENEKRAPTDDERFYGAARLVIDPAVPGRLSGEYWNNRSWRRGVNAAGRLTLIKRLVSRD
ncbi:hypothetical protein [Bradyrhizobium sp. SZCCHNRI3042]|uniref:hypothetical protein n=1 Tax=Bradyrhizobium sp. SZCCHNRI3042 TaxID=3057291 RepID=UPI002915FF47|nr:hypothetical protein [Bradyrhizobium sp. SZCCHNRI3042]